jgi:hypothetical protein
MQATISFNKKDLCALSVLCLFCLYLFREIVLSGHLLAGIDFIEFYLPMKKFLFDELRLHQAIPYWNPFIFGGMPYLAHFESTVFYPLGFLFWLLPPEKAYGYTMALHLFLGGFFMYLLMRSFAAGRIGAFVSSAVFTCNGYVMAILYLGHMSPIQSTIWLPLVLYFLNRSLSSREFLFSALVAGVLWGVQILAGAPQDAFYTFLASILFLICSLSSSRPAGKSLLKVASSVLLLFSFGSGLSAVQILPAFELIKESVRASLATYEMVTMGSYPLQGVITLLLPQFFGSYADGTVWIGNVPWSIPQQTLYTGILPLALLGFVSLRSNGPRRFVIFGGLTAVLSLVLAFGHHTPLYKLVYLLPGFDRFRAPSKILVLWGFSVALLAGLGMDGLLRYVKEKHTRRLVLLLSLVISLIVMDLTFRADRSLILRFFSPFVLPSAIPGKTAEAMGIVASEFHRLTLLTSFILLLALLMRRNLLPVSVGAASLCALLLVDLGYVHGKAVRHDNAIYQTMDRIKQSLDASLGQDKTPYRVGSFKNRLGANLEMVLGYQTVGGFTALFPSGYYEYMNAYTENRLPEGWVNLFYGTARNAVLMDLLNVKYEISHTTHSYALRESFLPRAFMVADYQILEREEILNFMTEPSFDPRKTLVFEKDGLMESPPRYPSRQSDASGVFELTLYRPDAMVIETRTSEPGYLVVSENFYPGWKASVDGHRQRILRGNYLFRVIELPEGKHKVELFFDSSPIRLGMAVSAFVISLFLTFLFYRLFFKGFLKRP